MVQKEYDILLNIINQMIDNSEPRRAEYYRGYRSGIQANVLSSREEMVQEHFRLHDDSDWLSGDQYVDAFTRGYRDGCKGIKPEHTP